MRRDFLSERKISFSPFFLFLKNNTHGTKNELLARLDTGAFSLHQEILEYIGISQETVELTQKQIELLLTHQKNFSGYAFSTKTKKARKRFEKWVNEVFYTQ